MSAGGGANDIAGDDTVSSGDGLAPAFALNLAAADAQGHFANGSGRVHCRRRRQKHPHHQQQTQQPSMAKQLFHHHDPFLFHSGKYKFLIGLCDVRGITSDRLAAVAMFALTVMAL
ncbi:MAG: hypothetical protein AW09_001398 [Candidatus Accumulibacter phosphatis]|uniref:Uncharacterized protein n=1 Tax=Candidatus Accumulibacter phosphatis TaxID=327160 RepID=A0A080M884_9PROT|nr:MAG: hypothetical protein AW09_001398 [Candidatus Accumulibacter phosphatis]